MCEAVTGPHCPVEEGLHAVLRNGLWSLIVLNLNLTAWLTLALDRYISSMYIIIWVTVFQVLLLQTMEHLTCGSTRSHSSHLPCWTWPSAISFSFKDVLDTGSYKSQLFSNPSIWSYSRYIMRLKCWAQHSSAKMLLTLGNWSSSWGRLFHTGWDSPGFTVFRRVSCPLNICNFI